ncbi:MAG: hypothetical protein AMJ79_05410 [Phycisphaerae bacterium SM23_30]|nr:MAG: hypothetical protein AMJ79_05410 [Phycisphaerae bacterium SM23_30]
MNAKKSIFCMLLLFCCSATTVDAYYKGDGTIYNPYQIADKADLFQLARTTADYDAYFILVNDIDLDPNTFKAALIAPDTSSADDFQGVAFTGVFDGKGHVIGNLTINTGDARGDFLGLFGYLGSYGEIKNLGLENVSITAGDDSLYIGGLAGANMQGTISQCYVTGAVNGQDNTQYLGGLTGANGGIIGNCYATASVAGASGSQMLGGLVGLNGGRIDNCYATGVVTGAGSYGGFAGLNYTTILSCYFLFPGGGPDNGIAAPYSDLQMRNQYNFAGWDFFAEAANGINEIWQMDGYPVFNWQVPVALLDFALFAQFWLTADCPKDSFCSTVDYFIDRTIDTKDLHQLALSWLGPQVITDYLRIEDDFETGDFTRLNWKFSGDAPWRIDPNTVFEGKFSARSGKISHSQNSALELTVDTTDYDVIVFQLKVSSEEDYDFLIFYIDGQSQPGLFSGEMDWLELSYNLSSGTHTFKWDYIKSADATDGKDSAWIDNVRFIRRNE